MVYDAGDHAEYLKDGYYIFPKLFSKDWVKKANDAVDRILAQKCASNSAEWIMNAHLIGQDWILETAMTPVVLNAVSYHCGNSIVLMQSQLFCKSSSNACTPWHQDASSNVSSMATLWIPLQDVNDENGTLQVIPKQHQYGVLPNEPCLQATFERTLSPSWVKKQTKFVYEMKAGQGAFHHPLLPHASTENQTNTDRRILILRYIALDSLRVEQIPTFPPTTQSVPVIKSQIEENDEEEWYQDYRTENIYFKGVCLLLN